MKAMYQSQGAVRVLGNVQEEILTEKWGRGALRRTSATFATLRAGGRQPELGSERTEWSWSRRETALFPEKAAEPWDLGTEVQRSEGRHRSARPKIRRGMISPKGKRGRRRADPPYILRAPVPKEGSLSFLGHPFFAGRQRGAAEGGRGSLADSP